jgi:protein-S-isoprenylcysteine O-methyltransferase Ste14
MTKFLERSFVWLGGALFVASLVLTGWSYARWLGQPRPWAGWRPLIFDVLLFSVFALHHSLFARSSVKATLAAVCPDRLLRSVYVWVASALLIVVCLAWKRVGGDPYEATHGALRVLHFAVQLTGAWLIVQSVRAIDALELAGIRASSAVVDAGTLCISGPYQLVRHPLYLGWILIVFGSAHLTGDRLAFAAITTCYLLMAIPWEERSLAQAFGTQYARYAQRVRWRVVPFLY